MKKILKWVLPALFGIVPTLGMQELDPFYTKDNTAVYIAPKGLFETEDGTISMRIKGSDGEEMRAICVKPTLELIDCEEENRQILQYRGTFHATFQCGKHKLEGDIESKVWRPYPSEYQDIYYLNQVPIEPSEIPLGGVADIGKKILYKHPIAKSVIKEIIESTCVGQVMARGFYAGQEITTPEQFLALNVSKINVHETAIGEMTTADDPVIYELLSAIVPIPGGVFEKCIDHNFKEKQIGKSDQRCCYGTHEIFNMHPCVFKKDSDGTETLLYQSPTIAAVMLYYSGIREQRGIGNKNHDVEGCLRDRKQYLPHQINPQLPVHYITEQKPVKYYK